MPELGCTSAVQNEKYIFHFVLLSAECMSEHKQALRHAIPVGHANLGFDTPSWQYYSWYSCICKSRHRALTCKYSHEDASPPKLACVQDIRPHVPELGCTSAVQNEKIHFFIFVLLVWLILARAAYVRTQASTAISPIGQLGFDAPSWQYFIRGIHVFASQGIEP